VDLGREREKRGVGWTRVPAFIFSAARDQKRD
jgi:hypothetical protein